MQEGLALSASPISPSYPSSLHTCKIAQEGESRHKPLLAAPVTVLLEPDDCAHTRSTGREMAKHSCWYSWYLQPLVTVTFVLAPCAPVTAPLTGRAPGPAGRDGLLVAPAWC